MTLNKVRSIVGAAFRQIVTRLMLGVSAAIACRVCSVTKRQARTKKPSACRSRPERRSLKVGVRLNSSNPSPST